MHENASITIATERGREAYWACRELTDNPFPPDSPEYAAWVLGYQDAERQDG